jgi:hypothetical protein
MDKERSVDESQAAATVFACNLLALTAAQREHHAGVVDQIKGAIVARRELANGIGFQFAPQAEMLRLLADFVAHERLCCPFFAFAIRLEAQQGEEPGPLWLELTGAQGIQAFIEAELDW